MIQCSHETVWCYFLLFLSCTVKPAVSLLSLWQMSCCGILQHADSLELLQRPCLHRCSATHSSSEKDMQAPCLFFHIDTRKCGLTSYFSSTARFLLITSPKYLYGTLCDCGVGPRIHTGRLWPRLGSLVGSSNDKRKGPGSRQCTQLCFGASK